MADSPNTTPARRSRMACTECRQSKLRCDYPKNPCSRCERLGLKCETIVGYKRVEKKRKLDELEKQVQLLRSAVSQGGNLQTHAPEVTANGNTALFPNSAPTYLNQSNIVLGDEIRSQSRNVYDDGRPSTRDVSMAPSMPVTVDTAQTTPQSVAARPPTTTPRTIQSIELSPHTVNSLFERFFKCHHPFLPYLDPLRSPDQYYHSSPLLFWAIASVGSRGFAEDPSLCDILYQAMMNLVWTTISSPPLSLANTQALLLICLWPHLLTSMWTDPSQLLSGIALNSAMHMGLHRPGDILAFTRMKPWIKARHSVSEPERQERLRTWAACNIVAQRVTADNGHPPTHTLYDWTADRACEVGTAYSLPDELRHQLIIHRFINRVAKTMSGNRADPVGLPGEGEREVLTTMLESELDIIAGQFGKAASDITQIILLAARLYLQAFHFFPSSLPSRKSGILKAYSSATSLVSRMIAGENSSKILQYAPSYYVRLLFMSSCIFFKILTSTFAQYIDVDAGKALFNTTIFALRCMAIEKEDIGSRGAELLTQAWKAFNGFDGEMHPSSARFEPLARDASLHIKSRSGASVMYDVWWQWREAWASSAEQNPKPDQVDPSDGSGNDLNLENSDPSQIAWQGFDDASWLWDFDLLPDFFGDSSVGAQ